MRYLVVWGVCASLIASFYGCDSRSRVYSASAEPDSALSGDNDAQRNSDTSRIDDSAASVVEDTTSDAATQAYGPFVGSYIGKSHDRFSTACTQTEPFVYYTPCDKDGGGCTAKYPVLFWVHGTCMPHDGLTVHELLKATAMRGFIAVSPAYFNGGHDGPPGGVAEPHWCDDHEDADFCKCSAAPGPYMGPTPAVTQAKAQCIFDAAQNSSAVGKICALPFANCDAMVAMGASQGSNIVTYSPQWGSIVGVVAYSLTLITPHVVHANRGWLPDDHLLEIHGAADTVCVPPIDTDLITFLSTELFDSNATPELDCTERCTSPTWLPANFPSCDCRVTTSPRFGYVVVGSDDVSDGMPEHAFMCDDHDNEEYIGECSPLDPHALDPNGSSTEHPWSLNTALDFLTARVAAADNP